MSSDIWKFCLQVMGEEIGAVDLITKVMRSLLRSNMLKEGRRIADPATRLLRNEVRSSGLCKEL